MTLQVELVSPERIAYSGEAKMVVARVVTGDIAFLTGHVPFEAPTVEEVVAAHIHTPLTPPNHVVPEITQPTSDALLIAMAKNPAERYPTYDDFRMALEAARSQLLINQLRNQKDTTPAAARGWWRR